MNSWFFCIWGILRLSIILFGQSAGGDCDISCLFYCCEWLQAHSCTLLVVMSGQKPAAGEVLGHGYSEVNLQQNMYLWDLCTFRVCAVGRSVAKAATPRVFRRNQREPVAQKQFLAFSESVYSEVDTATASRMSNTAYVFIFIPKILKQSKHVCLYINTPQYLI